MTYANEWHTPSTSTFTNRPTAPYRPPNVPPPYQGQKDNRRQDSRYRPTIRRPATSSRTPTRNNYGIRPTPETINGVRIRPTYEIDTETDTEAQIYDPFLEYHDAYPELIKDPENNQVFGGRPGDSPTIGRPPNNNKRQYTVGIDGDTEVNTDQPGGIFGQYFVALTYFDCSGRLHG